MHHCRTSRTNPPWGGTYTVFGPTSARGARRQIGKFSRLADCIFPNALILTVPNTTTLHAATSVIPSHGRNSSQDTVLRDLERDGPHRPRLAWRDWTFKIYLAPDAVSGCTRVFKLRPSNKVHLPGTYLGVAVGSSPRFDSGAPQVGPEQSLEQSLFAPCSCTCGLCHTHGLGCHASVAPRC